MRDGGTGRMSNGDTISTVSTPSSQVSTTHESNLWDNASNNQQCGLYENDTLNNQEGVLYEIGVPGDQQGVLYEISVPGDHQCVLYKIVGERKESSATREAFEATCPVSRHLALAVALT